MRLRAEHRRLWIWIFAALLIVAVSGFAVQRSVTVRARWTVLPYQSLRLTGSGEEVSAFTFEHPNPTALDIARGYIEREHAMRLHVVSNTPWKIQIQYQSPGADATSDMLIRQHGGDYLTLSDQPQILAQGANGVFEISIDYRLLAGSNGEFPSRPSADVVYTIMAD